MHNNISLDSTSKSLLLDVNYDYTAAIAFLAATTRHNKGPKYGWAQTEEMKVHGSGVFMNHKLPQTGPLHEPVCGFPQKWDSSWEVVSKSISMPLELTSGLGSPTRSESGTGLRRHLNALEPAS